MKPTIITIDNVLTDLDAIIEQAIKDNSPHGYFAYIYRRTTAQIKTGIENKRFEDNERMHAFDVLFASYYLDAYQNYTKGLPVCEAWKICFESQTENLIINQHLMMGMNAHINLDLAVAASTFMKNKPIQDFENDFKKVNEILAELTHEMQVKIGRTSYFMFLLDWLGQNRDDQVINFSITKARGQSWRTAQLLWALEEEEKLKFISEVDIVVKNVSIFIKNPSSKMLKFALKIIYRFEGKNVAINLQKLAEHM